MKASATPLDLPTLHRFYGTLEQPTTVDDGFEQTAPARLRKVYRGPARRGRWVFRPNILGDGRTRPSISQISRGVDEDSAWGIQCKVELAILQLAERARAGDKEALRSLVLAIGNAIQDLSSIATEQPGNVKALAETHPYWPLRLSPNPQDITRAKGYLKELGVGAKAPTPTGSRQRIDRGLFWSTLARQAREVCLLNTFAVQALTDLARGSKSERKPQAYWRGKKEQVKEATYYYLKNDDVVIVADWQEQCLRLSARVTEQNFHEWWRALQGCVLDYWHCHPKEYEKALAQLGKFNEKDYRKRNLALARLRQAFRSHVGLR